MNVIIIEDELISAQDLADYITQIRSNYKIVAIIPTVEASINYLSGRDHTYDLIFSDIQLGDGLCFEIFQRVRVAAPVIFCTAHNEYMLEAFKTNGIDYILKPFDRAQVANAINKFEHLTGSYHHHLETLIKHLEKQDVDQNGNTILVYQNKNIIPVDINDIALIYLMNNKVHLKTFDQRVFIIPNNLEAAGKQLNRNFFRANRQFFVHRKAIRNASYYHNRRLVINLSLYFEGEITVSKERSPEFLKWLSSF